MIKINTVWLGQAAMLFGALCILGCGSESNESDAQTPKTAPDQTSDPTSASARDARSNAAPADTTEGPARPSALWTVTAPDGALTVTIRTNDQGGLHYRADLEGGLEVVGWSSLGLTVSRGNSFNGGEPVVADFSQTVSVSAAETGEFRDAYRLVSGKRRDNSVVATTLVLAIDDDETGDRLAIDFRVQNDGFGFRYRLPGDDPLFSVIENEHTTFAMGTGGTFWGQPYDIANEWKPAYETPFDNALPAGTPVGTRGTGWGFPSLFQQSNGVWVLLHEAGLTPAFHGSHLKPEAPEGEYQIAPPLAESAFGYGKSTAASTRPWASPWRVAIAGRDPGTIVESNLVFDFAEPSRIEDTSWIKPGLASWSWLSDHDSSRNMTTLKDFIDLSTEMGWPYSLIDANWNTISETSLEELAAYAASKGVGLFFWYNSGGRHNTVPEAPRNIMNAPARRRAEFAKLQRLGVKGVKVDFFQSDKQDMIALYHDILEDAAAHNIMVNFHGCTIPRGWERTWPNLVTMEAVRGGEVYTFPSEPDYGALAPWHNTILPFTRNVIGSMDYTPVIYSDQMIARRTTNAHETALAVIFESGVQHIGDSATSLRALPDEYLDFFRTLPTVWDETRYLAGMPGDHVVLARRYGGRWYVAGINGSASARTITLDLSFLSPIPEAGILLHDDASGRAFASTPVLAPSLGDYALEMNPYGGFVLVFE